MQSSEGSEARVWSVAARRRPGFFRCWVPGPRGRFFQPDEDDTSSPPAVVVLGDALWRTQFGATESHRPVVTINDEPHTVLGSRRAGLPACN